MLPASPMKLRRHGALFFLLLLLVPFTTVIFFTGPDLSQEEILQHKIVELRERLHHAEMLNQERRSDVINLRQKFNILLNAAPSGNGSVWMGRGALSKETKMILSNLSGSLDLQLPSIYHFLPHLLGNPAALQPAYKVAKGRAGVSLVLGIPTVKRDVQTYLMTTLQNLIENMNEQEKLDSLIVVFIAESDLEYVKSQADDIEKQFATYVQSGLLEVIAPPAAYYPKFEQLRQTLGDSMDRVKWRTKQNLDFAFLMMYCQAKGTYYVQLEDDILTKPGYITTMKKFALQKTSEKSDWFILDFCQLGFIGKMFKSTELLNMVLFLVMFHNDKPGDWLVSDYLHTRLCRFDKDMVCWFGNMCIFFLFIFALFFRQRTSERHCKKAKDSVWLHYKPSLFQHVGMHSSLKGKVQKLKDKQFGKVPLHFPHKNPPAQASTNLKAYKTHTIEKAYQGDTFFWGLLPQAGDWVNIQFNPPAELDSYLFRSGNAEHPNDKFYNTTVEVFPENNQTVASMVLPYSRSSDGFLVIGRFNEAGVAQGAINTTLGPIKILRLKVHIESDTWVILSELHIVPVGQKGYTR